MVVRISDKTQNYSKVTKLLVKPKGNTLMKNIKFYVILILVAALVLALWYDWNHPEINLFPMLFPILV